MTPTGIEICKAGWLQLLATVKRVLDPGLREDPMLSGLVGGMEQSIPQICDLALAGLNSRPAPAPRPPVAVTVRTVDDLRVWLAEHPNEPLVLIPRPLAEQVTAAAHGGLH
jgi:hypothetical protein